MKRWENIFQIKEQDKNLREKKKKKKNEVKISKLPSKEFEIMIIKMFNKT